MKELIHSYEAIFQEPTEFPPSRQYDHSISLLPNSVPINCMPYRYSPEQKNEIERQVSSILKSGIIIPSLSPYDSPVLLVRKRMIHVGFVLIIGSLTV
jgi:hypothetical protein